jgi:multicomponent Na+:H+ antiporter subunit A
VFGRKLRKKRELPKIKDVGIAMLVGPLLLLLLSIGLGIFGLIESREIFVPNVIIALGLSWLGGGILLFFEQKITSSRLPIPPWLSFNHLYAAIGTHIPRAAIEFTLLLQGGKLRIYVALLLMSLLGLVSPPFLDLLVNSFTLNNLLASLIQLSERVLIEHRLGDIRLYEYVIVFLIPIGILATIRSKTTLDAIMGVGFVGTLLALLFVIFGAPDLALTQLIVELLSLVLLLLIFSVLPPRFERISSRRTRIRDGLIALSVGALITGLTLTVALTPRNAEVADYYLEQSLPKGHGANVVNIILTDFRGLDTLGEITVLFAAMLGIYGLLYFRQRP